MSELIKLSEAVTMGLHAVLYLAAQAERIVPLKEVAEKLAVSENHLSKVFQRMGKADIVKATRGPTGGYVLARKPADIALIEVFTALEGPIRPKFCLFNNPVCLNGCCGLGELIGRQNQEIIEFLSRTRVSDAAGIFAKGARK
jgi:Rrf2 family protein